MTCHKNTRSSRINLNNPCNPCNPCDSCNRCSCECQCDIPDYCEDGCLTIQPSDCSTYSGENIDCVNIKKGDTITEVIKKITAKLCDCCSTELPICYPLSVTASLITPTSFRLNISGLSLGDTWDISLDNGLTYAYLGLTTSFKDITSLSSNTSFIVKVRHNVTGVLPCYTVSEVATTACVPLIVNTSLIGQTTARLTVTNLLSGELYDVSIDGGITYAYTSISASVLDISGLVSASSNHIVVRRVLISQLDPCTTDVYIQTYPCPEFTGTLMGVLDNLNPALNPNELAIKFSWTAQPGATGYQLVSEGFGFDVTLPPTTLSQTFNLPRGFLTPLVTLYVEYNGIGKCAYPVQYLAGPGNCTTISQITVVSTSSNTYGPIFNIGYGSTALSMSINYRKEGTPANSWIPLPGGPFPGTSSLNLIPTSSAPLLHGVNYQFQFIGTCENATHTWYYATAMG